MKRGLLVLLFTVTLANVLFLSYGTPTPANAAPSDSTDSVLDTLNSSPNLTGEIGGLEAVGLSPEDSGLTIDPDPRGTACDGLSSFLPWQFIPCIIEKINGVVANTFSKFLTSTMALAFNGVYSMASEGDRILVSEADAWREKVNGSAVIFRNIALSLLTIAILVISLANIIGFQRNNYALNRMIPKLFITMFMVFFIHAIATLLLGFINSLGALMLDLSSDMLDGGGYWSAYNGVGSGLVGSTWLTGALSTPGIVLALLIFIIIFVLIPSIALMIILYLRIFVLFVLLSLAPLAAMMNLLPFTEKYYNDWWKEFWKWGFMGFVIQIHLILGAIFIKNFVVMGRGNLTEFLVALLVIGVVFGLATKNALSSGGAITAGVAGLANLPKKALDSGTSMVKKRAGEEFSDRTGLSSARAFRTQKRAIQRGNIQNNATERLIRSGSLGQSLLGVSSQEEVKKLQDNLDSKKEASFAETLSGQTADDMLEALERGNLQQFQIAALLKAIHKENPRALAGKTERLSELASLMKRPGMGGMNKDYALDIMSDKRALEAAANPEAIKAMAMGPIRETPTYQRKEPQAKALIKLAERLRENADDEIGKIAQDIINDDIQYIETQAEAFGQMANAEGRKSAALYKEYKSRPVAPPPSGPYTGGAGPSTGDMG